MKESAEGPRVVVPPPLVFAAGYFAGWLLETRVMRLQLVPAATTPRTLLYAGEVVLILGAILALWAVLTFRRARTPVIPYRAASQLVTEGPYRLSRNPMYIGMSGVHIGLAMVMNMTWPLILLPLVLLAVYALVISREERHLRERFGTEYEEYRQRVRRWV